MQYQLTIIIALHIIVRENDTSSPLSTTWIAIMPWDYLICQSRVQIVVALPSNIWYKSHICRQLNCWSLRCSWSIACWRCSNHIFVLDLTPGFNRLGKDNCRTSPETFQFWHLVRLILESWRYSHFRWKLPNGMSVGQAHFCLVLTSGKYQVICVFWITLQVHHLPEHDGTFFSHRL